MLEFAAIVSIHGSGCVATWGGEVDVELPGPVDDGARGDLVGLSSGMR